MTVVLTHLFKLLSFFPLINVKKRTIWSDSVILFWLMELVFVITPSVAFAFLFIFIIWWTVHTALNSIRFTFDVVDYVTVQLLYLGRESAV